MLGQGAGARGLLVVVQLAWLTAGSLLLVDSDGRVLRRDFRVAALTVRLLGIATGFFQARIVV
jgi:hypothetical protein